MPSISPIFNKLTEMARDIETDPGELVKLIMLDPVLTGKVIKLVNSAYYGLSAPVSSLAQAVVVLGLNTVKNLAMYTAALDKLALNQEGGPLDPQAFWSHCLATAVGCRLLAKAQQAPANELEMHFLAGLLHDLGKVPLIKAVPDIYRIVFIRSAQNRIPLAEMEQEHFGFAHPQVGRLLAARWKLDPLLTEAIEGHHMADLVTSGSPITCRVMVINNLCKQAEIGHSGNIVVDAFAEEAAKSLETNPASLQAIAAQLPRELEKALKFLKVKEDPNV